MKRKTLLRILRFARPHMPYIVLSLVMAVASVSMTLYAPGIDRRRGGSDCGTG